MAAADPPRAAGQPAPAGTYPIRRALPPLLVSGSKLLEQDEQKDEADTHRHLVRAAQQERGKREGLHAVEGSGQQGSQHRLGMTWEDNWNQSQNIPCKLRVGQGRKQGPGPHSPNSPSVAQVVVDALQFGDQVRLPGHLDAQHMLDLPERWQAQGSGGKRAGGRLL